MLLTIGLLENIRDDIASLDEKVSIAEHKELVNNAVETLGVVGTLCPRHPTPLLVTINRIINKKHELSRSHRIVNAPVHGTVVLITKSVDRPSHPEIWIHPVDGKMVSSLVR